MDKVDFSGVFSLMLLGFLTLFVGMGAFAGLIVATPFALWFHDAAILLWPTAAGAALGLVVSIYTIVRHG